MRKKITIVGAGNVGATTALWLAAQKAGDIVLVDVMDGIPQGKALDLQESAPLWGFDSRITGYTNDYGPTEGSDVIVLTGGLPRKPGMSRDDLLKVNKDVVADTVVKATAQSPDATVIVLTNPVDVMTYVAQKASGLPYQKVMGQAGVLDSARFRTFLALELGVSVRDVSAFVMGGHGDQMVPLVRYSHVGGIPIEKLLPAERIEAIVQRTRVGGGEIVNLLKNASAYYAPGLSLAEMVQAVLNDEKRVLPVVAYLNGEFDQRDIYVGVPAVIGAGGVERILQVDFTADERQAFTQSVEAVRGPLKVLGY